MNVDRIILDPSGFVVIEFDNEEARSEFIDNCVPGGTPYGAMRINTASSPFHVAWKLSDLELITIVAEKRGTNLRQPPDQPSA